MIFIYPVGHLFYKLLNCCLMYNVIKKARKFNSVVFYLSNRRIEKIITLM